MTAVFCCWCHARDAHGAVCRSCGKTPLLDGSWKLTKMLGHGAAGHTWRAQSVHDGRVRAIKELSVRRLTDLKQLDLFTREAATLKALDHPAIPDYEADFVVEDERFVSFYLVQELVEGEPLVVDGRFDEAQVCRLLVELADVLGYLGSRRPSVVHRDIKPANIMRRPDGHFVLIDFGATRAAVGQSMAGSTVAGTFGYMAPEQLLGRASPASDFYGLGATAVALLAGRDAGEVLDPHRPGAWRRHVKASKPLMALLEDMLEVDGGRRLSEPKTLRRRLEAIANDGAVSKVDAAMAPRSQGVQAADTGALKAVRDLIDPPRQQWTWRDRLVELGRKPVEYLPWLFAAVMMGFLALLVATFVTIAVSGGAPPFVVFWGWPASAVAAYMLSVAAGVYLGRRRVSAEVDRVLRYRKLRWFRGRTYRASGTGWVVILFFAIMPAAFAGNFTATRYGEFWYGVAAVGALIVADQLHAVFRGRNGWRRALHGEFDRVWPRGSEARRLFVRLANAVWCSVPGIAAKSSASEVFGTHHRALLKLGQTDLTGAQREHAALVLLVCHAAFADGDRLDESMQALALMQPRKATQQALLAAVDEADDDERARRLAAEYLRHTAAVSQA